MKIDKFMPALEVYESLYNRSECQDKAECLRVFREVFVGQEKKTVIAVVNHVVKHWKAARRTPAYPADLREVIVGIEAVHRTLGPVGFANDFRKLLELFSGSGGLSMAVFANDFMQAVNAVPVASVKRSRRPDAVKIKNFVKRLRSSIADTDQFRELLGKMKAPREATKAELVLIAEQFLGYKEKYGTKGDVVEALRVWQLHNAIQKSQDQASVEI